MTTNEPPATAALHRHIDACAHCKAHPFALCLVGLRLLRAAVEDFDHRVDEVSR
jgi:hypothetical protein